MNYKRLLSLFVTAIIALAIFSLGAVHSDPAERATPLAQGGYSYGYDPITWLTEARDSHQWYVDHPGDQTDATGDTEHNRVWVERYNLVIEELKK